MNYSNWLETDLPIVLTEIPFIELRSINIGPRYRVVANCLSGSLWLEPQLEAFRLNMTGDVLSVMRGIVVEIGGEKAFEDQGYPVWKIKDPRKLRQILRAFGRKSDPIPSDIS